MSTHTDAHAVKVGAKSHRTMYHAVRATPPDGASQHGILVIRNNYTGHGESYSMRREDWAEFQRQVNGSKPADTVAAALLTELQQAYAAIEAQGDYYDDPDGNSQAIGRYDGLKRAYVMLTGQSDEAVASQVVGWYVHTPEYAASKRQEG